MSMAFVLRATVRDNLDGDNKMEALDNVLAIVSFLGLGLTETAAACKLRCMSPKRLILQTLRHCTYSQQVL
jgi:hypothetical protein